MRVLETFMRMHCAPVLATATCLLGLAPAGIRTAHSQTPEQQQSWDAQRAAAQADERAKAAVAAHQREIRRADPMGWVRTLDPMTAGGWEFRVVASDGSWATYSTRHQLKRAGKTVTAWLRQEYAEPQTNNGTHYMSLVEKVQFDCAKDLTRALLVIYYSANNVQGSEQTEEADSKNTPWTAIVPGTRDESNALWACAAQPG